MMITAWFDSITMLHNMLLLRIPEGVKETLAPVAVAVLIFESGIQQLETICGPFR